MSASGNDHGDTFMAVPLMHGLSMEQAHSAGDMLDECSIPTTIDQDGETYVLTAHAFMTLRDVPILVSAVYRHLGLAEPVHA